MVAEEVVITLSEGPPWGFRLQGGAEHQKPLEVAKVRKRSKACRAGLREGDVLLSINEQRCGQLTHAQAMNLIDSCPGTLRIGIKRPSVGFQSVVLPDRAPSPRIDKEYRAALRALSPPGTRSAPQGGLISSTEREWVTSPLSSEAYYAETDSDVDAVHERQRRQRRRSPNEDGGARQENLPGVARREVVYQAPEASCAALAENGIEDSHVCDGAGTNESDSGFQEVLGLAPLVPPERAKEALRLVSRGPLVPIVGPVIQPVDEELTVTYMDRAKQAKLHRGESIQERQVKEARSKCRSIASLLTDAPNPHSKGVLMFKKRRQRAKKYTLISFGSVNGDLQPNGEQEEEEDPIWPGSESELDEDGFASVPDSTWDSDYLDVLERRTPAHDGEFNGPGLDRTSGKGAQLFEQQRKKTEGLPDMKVGSPVASYTTGVPMVTAPVTPAIQVILVSPTTPITPVSPTTSLSPITPTTPITPSNYSSVNGDLRSVNKASMLISPQAVAAGLVGTVPSASSQQVELPSGSVLNKTARPFTPGFVSHRAATSPVVFRPNIANKALAQAVPLADSTQASSSPSPTKGEGRRAVSVTSLYIPARSPAYSAPPPTVHPPPAAVTSTPFSPPMTPFSPTPTVTFPPPTPVYSSPSVPSTPSCPSTMAFPPSTMPYSGPTTSATPFSPPPSAYPPSLPLDTISPSLTAQKVSFSPFTLSPPAPPVEPRSTHSNETLVSREQRISVPAARTGILQEARRRGSKKPMFSLPEEKKTTSPNPELLSLVQNLDEKTRAGGEAGFESGPEEDLLNLGAEACNFMQSQRNKLPPPPVAPKPSSSPVPQMGGKGAELFARRQSRMDRYVVGNAIQQPAQAMSPKEARQPSPTPSLPAQWKYSPNIRAPPPISYNPLLSPSCPPTAQRSMKSSEANRVAKKGSQNQGIKAVDVLSRQPHQLNASLFTYGGGVPQAVTTPYQAPGHLQAGQTIGSTLGSPRQVPIKAARVHEVKRFSTPTPMSAPSSLTPTTIVPRSATTLGEPLWLTEEAFANNPHLSPPATNPINTSTLPELPKISAFPISNPISVQALNPTHDGLQAMKQFKSAPELSPLAKPTLQSPVSGGSSGIRVPRPSFSASRMGIQANVWKPTFMHS